MPNAAQLTDQARASFYDPALLNKDGNHQARLLLEEAINTKSDYALAHAALAYVYVRDWESDWGPTLEESEEALDKALEHANKSVDLYKAQNLEDLVASDCHWNRAIVYSAMGRFPDANADYDRAAFLNPKNYNMLAERGDSLVQQGFFKEAIKSIGDAITGRMNEAKDVPYTYYWSLARAHYMDTNYVEAIKAIDELRKLPRVESMSEVPDDISLIYGACLARNGQTEPGNTEMNKFKNNNKIWTVQHSARYKWANPNHQKHWLDGLRAAGMPEN